MKKLLFILVLMASLFIIRNLLISIYSLWQKQDLIVRSQDQLKREKDKNAALKEKIKEAQSLDFIEQEARNKLLMVKEGEQEILISKKLLASPDAPVQPHVKSNFQEWIDLFR